MIYQGAIAIAAALYTHKRYLKSPGEVEAAAIESATIMHDRVFGEWLVAKTLELREPEQQPQPEPEPIPASPPPICPKCGQHLYDTNEVRRIAAGHVFGRCINGTCLNYTLVLENHGGRWQPEEITNHG